MVKCIINKDRIIKTLYDENQNLFKIVSFHNQINADKAPSIIEENKTNPYVELIVNSTEFLTNPVCYLIDYLLKRGRGRAQHDDYARGIVIATFPGVLETLKQHKNLIAIARTMYDSDPNLKNIIKYIEISIENDDFKTDYNNALKELEENYKENSKENLIYAENKLRNVIVDLFTSAKSLKCYERNEGGDLESSFIPD